MSLQVQMKTQYCTPARTVAAGAKVTLPDAEALQLIDNRCAVAVDPEQAELRRRALSRKATPAAAKKATGETKKPEAGTGGTPPAGDGTGSGAGG